MKRFVSTNTIRNIIHGKYDLKNLNAARHPILTHELHILILIIICANIIRFHTSNNFSVACNKDIFSIFYEFGLTRLAESMSKNRKVLEK